MSGIPSVCWVTGSGKSFPMEHVPWPFWFVFTGLTTFSTLNVRHGAVNVVQFGVVIKVWTCVPAFHTLEPFFSLKITIETVASLPRLMTLGTGKVGLMSIRCVQGNEVVGT